MGKPDLERRKGGIALIAIDHGDDRSAALREIVSELLLSDEPRKRYVAMISSFNIHYDFGNGHPQFGRRMPHVDLIAAKADCESSPCCAVPARYPQLR